MNKSFLVATLILFGVSLGSFGQNTDFQSWNSVIIDWNISPFLFELELDYNRLLSEGEVWREYAAQPSVEYYPSASIDLFAGVYLTDTKQNDIKDTKEVRPLIGFRWNIIKPEKRVFLRTQCKYEYRFFSSSEDGKTNAGRLRIRGDLFIPITQKSYNMDKDLYGIVWTETFINFDNDIRERYQSTFRQYLGLGYRFNYNWRLEGQYVYQKSRDSISDEVPDNINNVIFLTLKHYIGK
ncbi:MAG: DUF2490 domain-containing protein [Cyclobacteriaceae bacterium]|nr:DUF2490 domain-containing protein [Cyclobacteriaceae bacterium]